MKIHILLIYAIAIWRVANLFVREAGPFHIFTKIRKWVGIQHDEFEFPYMIPDNFFAQVLSCVWCFSIWLAFFWTIFWLFSPEWSLRVAVMFSFSGGAIVLDLLVQRLKQ